MNKVLKNNIKHNKGFTLLVAVLVSSVLLSISLAIFNITIKELLLSSSGRDSQFAFYAADSGTECALYWDQKGGGFSTSTAGTINCNGTNIPNVGGVGYDTAMTFQFEVGGFCSIVSVTKSETHPRTKVESRGYNTTCDNTVNPRRIERAIRVTY
jgi:Tfp pilus assembly protein PilX